MRLAGDEPGEVSLHATYTLVGQMSDSSELCLCFVNPQGSGRGNRPQDVRYHFSVQRHASDLYKGLTKKPKIPAGSWGFR